MLHLFKRMTRLPLFLGIGIGLLVAICVVSLNDLEAKHLGTFFLDAPFVTEGLVLQPQMGEDKRAPRGDHEISHINTRSLALLAMATSR